MKDFFINLETPTLNSNYANSLNELVVNINQNFAKIASLPFLKGDSGVSIEVCDEVFYSDDEEFTPFACAVINAIYGSDIPEDEYKIDGHSSYEDLKNIKTIPVFYDKSQGKKYLTVPFMFHDARKNYLGEVINTEHSMNFVDMSTFVLGSGIYNGTEWIWDMSKHDFEPKLYFNSNTQKFCWAIGSQKTDIIAQGVEGKQGNSVSAKYCKGSFSESVDGTDQTYIYIDAILNDGSLTGSTQDYNYDISGLINDGDFVMVEFINPINGAADLAFGKVLTVGDNKCIPYFADVSLSGATSNIKLKELLDHVGESINENDDNVRGLYVYAKNKQTANRDNTDRKPHMFWADSNDDAHISKFKTEDATVENNPLDRNKDYICPDGTLHLDYKTTKAKTIDADLYTHKYLNIPIFSYGEDNTDKFESKITAIRVTPVSGKLSFIPNPKFVYNGDYESNRTSSSIIGPAVRPDRFTTTDTSLDLYQNQAGTNMYIINRVKLGGSYSFELPYLGYYNSANNFDVYNTVQFKKEGSNTSSIEVFLSLKELNNNHADTQNANNNTFYNYRHFLDVSLLASPICATENGDTCVYAGTSSEILTATINNIKYKANIKITVIQYKIGYNSDGQLEFKGGTWKSLTDPYKPLASHTKYSEDLCEQDGNGIDWYYQHNEGTYSKYEHASIKYNETQKPVTRFNESSLSEPWRLADNKKYKKYTSWQEKVSNFDAKNQNVVTEVIYSIIPTPSASLNGATDVLSLIDVSGSNCVSFRYRTMFTSDHDKSENMKTQYILPIDDIANTSKTLDNGTPISTLGAWNDNSMSTGNIFTGERLINTSLNNSNHLDRVYLLKNTNGLRTNRFFCPGNDNNPNKCSSSETFLSELGHYDDFTWVKGSMSNTACNNGIGSGRILPTQTTKLNDGNSKWILLLQDTEVLFYPKYSHKLYVNTKNHSEKNVFQSNVSDSVFGRVLIGHETVQTQFGEQAVGGIQIRLIPADNDGWYIGNEKVVTENVNNGGSYKKPTINN